MGLKAKNGMLGMVGEKGGPKMGEGVKRGVGGFPVP